MRNGHKPIPKKVGTPAPKPAPEKIPIDPQKLAGMVTEFASDKTYENLPSLRAMIAAQVKKRMGDLMPEEKIEVWKLISPEHQKVFKESLALADQVNTRTYPKSEEDPLKKMEERRAKEAAQNFRADGRH